MPQKVDEVAMPIGSKFCTSAMSMSAVWRKYLPSKAFFDTVYLVLWFTALESDCRSAAEVTRYGS